MNRAIYESLRPFRARQQWRRLAGGAALGLALGAVFGIALCMAGDVGAGIIAFTLVPVVGVVIGGVVRPRWRTTAREVDRHGGLADGARSSLEFAELAQPGAFHLAQLQHTSERIKQLNPRRVVRVHPPHYWPAAPLTYALAMAWMFWPPAPPPAPAAATEAVNAAADRVDQLAEQLQANIEKNDFHELKPLLEQLQELAAELRKPGTDVAAVMQKLSALQQQISDALRANDQTVPDKELKKLGNAFNEAAPLREAGDALQKGAPGEAADKLAKAANQPIPHDEARKLQSRLKAQADSFDKHDMKKEADATQQLANTQPEQPADSDGLKNMEKQLRERQRQKALNDLRMQLQRDVDECKNICQQRARQLNDRKKKSQAGEQPQPAAKPGVGDDINNAGREKSNTGRDHQYKDIQTGGDKQPASPSGKPTERQEDPKSSGSGPGERPPGAPDGGDDSKTDGVPWPRNRVEAEQEKQRVQDALRKRAIPFGHKEAAERYFRALFEVVAPPEKDKP